MYLTGPQLAQVRTTMLAGFNDAELTRLLADHLDLNREDYALHSDRIGRFAAVLEAANRQGWLADLLAAAAKERPRDPVLAAFGQDIEEAMARLVGMAGWAVRKRWQGEPYRQRGLALALAEAVHEATASVSADEHEKESVHDTLTAWLEREPVAGELSGTLDERPGSTLDLGLLAQELVAAGYVPLGPGPSAAGLVGRFVAAFEAAAAAQPELQGQIAIGLLRELAARAQEQVDELRKQSVQLDGIQEAIEQQTPLDLNDLERAYLRGLYADCNNLPSVAVDLPPDAKGRRPRLQRIYVDLLTDQRPNAELVLTRLGVPQSRQDTVRAALRRKLPVEASGREATTLFEGALGQSDAEVLRDALAEVAGVEEEAAGAALGDVTVYEAMRRHPRLVLLGDPGSGKSTLTRRVAGLLAAVARTDLPPDEPHWQAELQAATGRWLLPIRITLSRWAKQLPIGRKGCAADLVDECMRMVGEVADLEGPRPREWLVKRLTAQPPEALLLLDGLDEVADETARERMLAALSDFCDHYETPLLVTCRVRPYREGEHYVLPLPDALLAPLEPAAIERFVERWHTELTWAGFYERGAAEAAARRLLEAIDDRDRPELGEMAGTPLLLTMMARVNYRSGLPNSRAELYELFVKQLLWEWERQRQDDQGRPTGLELLLRRAVVDEGARRDGPDREALESALNKLAYQVHGQSGSRDTVDIPEGALRRTFEQLHPGKKSEKAAWAVDVLQLIDDRSGLIYALEQGAVYRFTHRTFQEYLAARWMAGGVTSSYMGKFREKIDLDQWREAVLLALGYQIAVLEQPDNALIVLDNVNSV